MTATEQQNRHFVELEHTFNAPIDRVFAAWTEPDQLMQWFHSAGTQTKDAQVDLRVGGVYSLTLKLPAGGSISGDGTVRIFGVFREVTPPTKLVYTWSFEPERETPVRDSIVTVAFRARGEWTDLTLRHEALPNELERDEHGKGWKGCVASLDAHLASA